jgi:hypothetical protein
MSELEKIIEELRLDLYRVAEGRSCSDPEVVAVSQKLDVVLDKYQRLYN